MAIYHLHVKVISRSNGVSVVASAAYRSASRLRDHRIDRSHDFTNKAGVVHSEILLPENAPEYLRERESLWNAVEAGEVRKDAQLAREIEFAIPREMTQEQGIELACDFVQGQFVDQGMIADMNVHWDIGSDGLSKPHAHVMLTMREVDEDGFGKKVRDWNARANVPRWREAWADHVNERLAALDIDVRIDHRTLEAQGIALEPQHKIGGAASRMSGQGLEADRLDEHIDIARENGERIRANPDIALDAITHQQATFTQRDLAMFVHRHSDGKDQFDQVMSAVRSSPELVALGKDGHGQDRFTSRSMIETERRLARASEAMAEHQQHLVSDRNRDKAIARATKRGLILSGEQRIALNHITGGRDLGIVTGYAGSGKSAMLGVAKDAWEADGYRVQGMALSGIAAENLESGSSVPSRTIASMEHQWAHGKEPHNQLGKRDILVIDEASMVGTRQMERVISKAQEHGAKIILVGDTEQLQAIEAGAAFRSIAERHPHVEITGIRRQQEDWQQDATRYLATGRTEQALDAYSENNMVHVADTREQARGKLIDGWDRERQAAPDSSRIILTHTNDEVRELNGLARERLRNAGELGEDVSLSVERGERTFATGDRVMFLRNERGLGIKNGTLGNIEQVSQDHMTVQLDSGHCVAFDLKDYSHIDHGYAATIHKAQGMTVDHSHVLATPGLDRHANYVALSRHRDSVQLHYGRDDFADNNVIAKTLSRERPKDMASDYRRDFAERRAIRAPEPGPERGEQKQGIFSSFRPRPVEPERGIFAGFKPKPFVPEKELTASLSNPPTKGLGRAVQRYARAQQEILAIKQKDLPVLPHQQTALDRADHALNELRPHGSKDCYAALNTERSLIDEAANGRTRRTIRAMQLETEIRTDPVKRADRFVNRWQGLNRQREVSVRAGNHASTESITARMGSMAKSLGRDAQVESILRNRKLELGIQHTIELNLSHELTQHLGLGRERGLGIGI